MRAIAAAALLLAVSAFAAQADEASDKAFAADLASAYAQALPGAPNVVDLLRDRFPADLAALAQAAAAPGASRPALLQQTIATIRTRDGDAVLKAPPESLRALIETDRALIAAAAEGNAPLCPALISGQTPPLPAGPVTLAYAARTYRLLAAIADGRDHPVAQRRANPDDFQSFAAYARRNGISIASWAVLAPTNLANADPAAVCGAMMSIEAAVLATDDALSDRLLADMADSITHQGGS